MYKRNEEEENEFKEEQSKLQEKLEDAYEIEKLSNDESRNEEKPELEENKGNKNFIWITLTIASIIIILSITFWYVKYKKMSKK